MPDVTIIGAGPAGSTAAILLSRAGWSVTLVEQSRFPREKVCGECLSALGFDVLCRLGISHDFLRLGAVRLNQAHLHSGLGRSAQAGLPTPMWGLSRAALDSLLLETARHAGARLLQPARCESISVSQIRIRDLVHNSTETLNASHVILADGKAAFATDAPLPTGDFGIKTHFAAVDGPRDAIELFGVNGSYGGLAAIEGGLWNAAFSVPAARIKACRGDLDALFREMASENPILSRRLASAKRTGSWLASPLPRFAVRRMSRRAVPVGNAAAALEPIGGEGMGLAMRSAELAAEALINGKTGTLRQTFVRLWRTRRFACRAVGVAISQRAMSHALLHDRIPNFATRTALRLIGKG